MVHGKDKEFHMLCGIDGCRTDFDSFAAFNSHVYRNHRQAMGLDKNEVPETSVTTDDEHPSIVDVACNISLGAGEDFHVEGGYSRELAIEGDNRRYSAELGAGEDFHGEGRYRFFMEDDNQRYSAEFLLKVESLQMLPLVILLMGAGHCVPEQQSKLSLRSKMFC